MAVGLEAKGSLPFLITLIVIDCMCDASIILDSQETFLFKLKKGVLFSECEILYLHGCSAITSIMKSSMLHEERSSFVAVTLY